MYSSLQIGRGIAAVLVVLAHLGSAISAEKYFGISEFSIPFSFGGSGVQFFFVLSGFIIFNIHKNDLSQPKKLGSYIKKRVIRVYPVFWIVFSSVFLIAYFTSLKNTLPLDFLTIIKTLLLVPQESSPVLAVAWTLQYELLFYIVFGFFILHRYTMYLFAFILIFLHIYYFNDKTSFPLAFFLNQNILLFVMGMIIAWLDKFDVKNMRYVYVVALSGAILFFLMAFDTILKTEFFSYSILIYGVSSSLLIWGAIKIEKNGYDFSKLKFLNLIGDASYSLYLIHYPLISILAKIALVLGLAKFEFNGALVSYFGIFAICIVIAIMLHKFIEKPILKYLHMKLK